MRFRWFVAVWVLMALVPAGFAAKAGECGLEYCWGALAAGPNGGAGRATAMRTAPDALARALSVCGSGCEMGEVFVNSCAAIAEDSKGARFFGWDADRDTALDKAKAACGAGQGYCRIRITACSR